jgi:hypothetical protein
MDWYWCQRHDRAEQGAAACRALDRLGPYPTRQDAENWREHAEARNEAWDEQDRAWDGDDSND